MDGYGPATLIAMSDRDVIRGRLAERMDRALHPDLVKRRAGASLGITSKDEMLRLTAQGEGRADVGDGMLEVVIEDIYEDVASATRENGR